MKEHERTLSNMKEDQAYSEPWHRTVFYSSVFKDI